MFPWLLAQAYFPNPPAGSLVPDFTGDISADIATIIGFAQWVWTRFGLYGVLDVGLLIFLTGVFLHHLVRRAALSKAIADSADDLAEQEIDSWLDKNG